MTERLVQTDFKDFSKITKYFITNRMKTTTGETAAGLLMKWMQYRKEAPETIAFKYDYDESFQEMQVACNEKPVNTVKTRQRRNKRGKRVTVPKSMPSVVPLLSTGPIPNFLSAVPNMLTFSHCVHLCIYQLIIIPFMATSCKRSQLKLQILTVLATARLRLYVQETMCRTVCRTVEQSDINSNNVYVSHSLTSVL